MPVAVGVKAALVAVAMFEPGTRVTGDPTSVPLPEAGVGPTQLVAVVSGPQT